MRLPKEKPLWLQDADGYEIAVIARHDAVDVYHGRRQMIAFSVSTKLAYHLAKFLIWFWVWSCWMGLRERIWRWRGGVQRRQEAKAPGVARRRRSTYRRI